MINDKLVSNSEAKLKLYEYIALCALLTNIVVVLVAGI